MIRNRSLLCLVSAFVLLQQSGCNKINDGTFVEPITLYEKVKGTWKLDDIVQVDHTAKTGNIKPDELNLYNEFEFPSFNIKLNVDEKNTPTSYEVLGNAPELFPNKGFWDLDVSFVQANGGSPQLRLYTDANKSALVGKLTIAALPGNTPKMEFTLTQFSDGVAFVSYQYKLSAK